MNKTQKQTATKVTKQSNKNNGENISHECDTLNNTLNSQENTENNDNETQENVTLQNKIKISREIIVKVPQRNVVVTIQEQITLKDRKIRNPW